MDLAVKSLFFQAEDAIRYRTVTGVQTCALPIYLFREALKNHTTADVLQLIEGFEAEDLELRRDCHPVVHAIGRETFRLKGNIHESFSACDQTDRKSVV